MHTFILKLFLGLSLLGGALQAQVKFTDYKFKDKFDMSAELKLKIQKTLESYLKVQDAGERVENELQNYFDNAEFTYERLGQKYRFKYSGKLTTAQRAIDRCEGELIPPAKPTDASEVEAGHAWKIEIDYCNFDL